MLAQTLSPGFAQTLQFGGAKRVLRHRAGDAVDVIDGLGTLYHCRPSQTAERRNKPFFA